MTQILGLWVPYILLLLFRFAQYLSEVPTVRMIEYAACHRLSDRAMTWAALDESDCKTTVVQDMVSWVVGWKMSSDAAPGLLSVLFFGTLADRYGHRPVLMLCCLGYLMALGWILMTCYFYETFPSGTALISSLFMFIGGGPLVFAAVNVALVADLVDATSRTRYLFVLAAMPHFAKLASPPIASVLMAHSLYLPSLASCAIVILCILIICSTRLPSRVQVTSTEPGESHEPSERRPFLDNRLDTTITTHIEREPDPVSSNHDSTLADTVSRMPIKEPASSQPTCIRAFGGRLVGTSLSLWCEPGIAFCCVGFFLKSIAMASEAFVFQYLSEKFNWPLRSATVLRLALSSGAVVTTLFLAPLSSRALAQRGIAAFTVDIGIVRLSLFALSICFVVAWRAASSTTFILSMLGAGFCEGLEPAMQGVLSGAARQSGSLLFALAFMSSLLGDMIGGPLMSVLVPVGRSSTGTSHGYCFLASAVLFGVMLLCACFVPLSKAKRIDNDVTAQRNS